MTIHPAILRAFMLLCALVWLPMAYAQTAARPLPAADQYSAKGADTCLECHDDESAAYSASAIFKTRHAQRGDKRAPFGAGGLQCEACHGPGALHARTKKAAAINNFKSRLETVAARAQPGLHGLPPGRCAQ